jgi:hypothetical protein
MSKNRHAPAGLEYVPVTEPAMPNIGFGVIRRTLGKDLINDVRNFVWKKLHPVQRPANHQEPWAPCCWRQDVLLPPGVPDAYDDPRRLCEQYEEQAFPGIKDLVVMTTIRFPGSASLNADWENVRAFAREKLAIDRKLPVVLAMHNPRQAGGSNPAHIHIMALARELDSSGLFGPFLGRLASDHGRAIMVKEWRGWRT